MDGNSSYHFKPKAPDNWSIKTHNRKGRKVRLVKLKPWQLDAHLMLRDASLGFIRAFCGSGKTIAARSIAAHKIYRSRKRQVFCVPKNDIGNDGFACYFDMSIPYEEGKKTLRCDSPINFCSPKSSSKIDELIRILCQDPFLDDCMDEDAIPSSMQIVCTHQCLTLALKKIGKNPRKMAKFIKNNTFWIDEGHHIKGHDESKEEKITMNLLGKFVNKLLASQGLGAELFAMTATPYRGDYSRIFSKEQMEGFVNYSLDFLEHFPTLGIERVDVEFEEYSDIDDVIRRVCLNIGEEIDNKHLVFVPPTNRKWRKNKDDFQKLLRSIHEVIMDKTGCDLETAKSRVLDLVTESTQESNDSLLRQEPKSGEEHQSRFTVVVACMKCREGSDWCPADRIHNTSMEDSPPLNFQTNGRLFRHFPGKKRVKIRYYAKKFKTIAAGKREFISDRVNRILHYMLMDDLLNPIMVNVPPLKPINKEGGKRTKKKSTLEDIFSQQYPEMKSFLLTSMQDVEFKEDAVDQVISHTLEKYLPENRNFTKGQVSQIRLALKAFLLRSRSGKLRENGIDASFIRRNGFDVIVESNGISGNMYTSNLNAREMKRFRQTVKKAHFTEEQTERIRQGMHLILEKRHPGMERTHQDYLDSLHHILRHEFCPIHDAYRKASMTNDFSPENVAKMLKKPVEHVRKMINMFNRFCMTKEIRFNFRRDSELSLKIWAA